MSFTPFFAVIAPLCLIWIGRPLRLLQLALITALFEAAAAVIIGGLGVQPSLLPALAFMAFFSLQLALGASISAVRPVTAITTPFVLVSLWGIAGSMVMPRLFAGHAYVWPQKQMPPFTLTMLQPTSSNVNQDVYLVIDCALMVLTALCLSRPGVRLIAVLRAYFTGGFVIVFIAVWQFGHKVAGLPFPDETLYSNPGWAILTLQSIGRVPRINASFAEPSALASYMASIVCATGWIILQGRGDTMTRLLFGAGLLTMALSTSATGFGVLAIVAAGIVAAALLTGSFRMMRSVLRIAVPLAVLIAVMMTGAGALVPGFGRNVQEVVTATLNKQESSSYNDRTSADLDSLQATLDTVGLGVGWGTNRSSSLIPGLAAGVGIPGLLGLLWFAARVAGAVRAARRARPSLEQQTVIDGCCGALTGFLVSAILSGPTINSVAFYILLGLLIGCTVRVRIDANHANGL